MKHRWNTFITRNIGLKITSLVLAIMLWFFVVSKGRSVVVMEVPVEFVNIPVDLEVVDSPKTVSVTIEGQERLLKKLRQEDVRAIFNLSDTKKGKIFIQVTPANISLPGTLTANEISPQTLQLRIEKDITKRVQVRPIIIGSPLQGYSVKTVEVNPSVIEVKGPESAIEKTYFIKTEAIDISGITGTLKHRTFLNLDGKNKVLADIPEVDVTITVKREM